MTSFVNRTIPGLAYRYCALLDRRGIILVGVNQLGTYDDNIYKNASAIPFLSGLLEFTGTLTEAAAEKLLTDLAELAEKPNALHDIEFAAKAMHVSQSELELRYIKKLTTSGAEYTLDSIIQSPSVLNKTLDTYNTMEAVHKTSHTKHMLDLAAELKVIEPIKGLKQVYRSELPELDGYHALSAISRALDGSKLPVKILRDMMLEALRDGGMSHHEIQHTLGLLFQSEAEAEEDVPEQLRASNSTGSFGHSVKKMQRHLWPGDDRLDPTGENGMHELWRRTMVAPEAETISKWLHGVDSAYRSDRTQSRAQCLFIKHTAECKKRLAKKKMRKQTRKASKK